MGRYRKAIAAAVSQALAILIAILTGAEPDEIPSHAYTISLLITPFLVWLIPNDQP